MNNRRYAFILHRLATILAVSTLTLTLTAAVTGVLLAFYYQPAAGRAFNSIEWIKTEVPNGWLTYGLHNVAGNAIIVVSLLQIIVMFLGERFRPSWLTAWISGILLTLTAIALGWTAMALNWTQLGYWRFMIELGSIEVIPIIGPLLRQIITGGGAINTITVEHLYTLHSYILSIGAVILSIIHLRGLLMQEQEEKVSRAASEDSRELTPET